MRLAEAPTVEFAEALLTERNLGDSLAVFNAAEAAGADRDRCAAGRWMCHMLLGKYEEAWLQSDGIRRRGGVDPHRLWNGESIAGKRVLIRCLHGYGDAVQYLRWLPLLRQLARAVVVQAAPEMQELLRLFSDADRVIPWTKQGESDQHLWDVQVEVAELPYLFRATVDDLPAPVRIRFNPMTLHQVREELAATSSARSRPRVGLVWTGSDYDSSRSIPFDSLHSLLSDPHVEFWSLQAAAGNQDWLHYADRHGWPHRTVPNGLGCLAAFASEMDLLITVDTLAAHLGGSLGLPTWTLLKRSADWRWMTGREDSPWYPSMRLFRQSTAGDWTTVLHQVRQNLRQWYEEREP